MNKKKVLVVSISCLVVGVLLFLLYTYNKPSLPEVTEEEVLSITFDRMEDGVYKTSNLSIKEFLQYYNKIGQLVENEEGEGSTATAIIIISLKSGTTINIGNSGTDFEISVKTKSREVKQYWGKQTNIRNLLYNGKY